MSDTWEKRWPRIRAQLSAEDREVFAAKFGAILVERKVFEAKFGAILVENDKLRAEVAQYKAMRQPGKSIVDAVMPYAAEIKKLRAEVERLRPMQISDRNWYDEAVKLRAMLEEAWCYISDPALSITIGTYLDGGDE